MKWDWLIDNAPWLLLAFAVLGAVLHAESAEAEAIGIMGGHWGKHWVSENVTNEEHELICLRVAMVQGCSFKNSYKQKKFSGESYSIGLVHDFELTDKLNKWNGKLVAKASVGATYGYTAFAGHDWSDKDYHPYAAGGPFYQQPIKGTKGKWEAGVLVFGDDTIPAAGILWNFDLH